MQSKSNSAKEPSVENGSGGRSRSRAAKVQANKKLDAQAKELAEFQRQNAASHAAAAKKQADRKKTGSPRKTVLGTRTSARLRGTTSGEDDEWQPIPAEWLEEASEEKSEKVGGRSTRSSARVKRKGKEPVRQEEVVEDEEEDQDEDRPSKADVNSDGDSSDLTELSDVESEAGSVDADPPDPQIKTKFTGRSSRRTNGKVVQSSVSEDETPIPSNEVDVSDTPALPADFIEWELVGTVVSLGFSPIIERFVLDLYHFV